MHISEPAEIVDVSLAEIVLTVAHCFQAAPRGLSIEIQIEPHDA